MFYQQEMPSKLDNLRERYRERTEDYKLDIITRDYDLAVLRLYVWLSKEDPKTGKKVNSEERLVFIDRKNTKEEQSRKNNFDALKIAFNYKEEKDGN